MYKHLVTATALLGLSLAGPAVRADSREQERAQHHMQAYLGVRADIAALGAEREGGVAILEVQPNGPAERAGLRKGDIITQVGRRVVEDFDDLCNAISRHQPGDRVAIQVQRDGQDRTLRVNLSERAAYWMPRADEERENQGRFGRLQDRDRYGRWQGDRAEQGRDLDRLIRRIEQLEDRLQEQGDTGRDRFESFGDSRSSAFLGVRSRTWNPSTSQRRGGVAEVGVQVTEIATDSSADEAGLRRGDVITAVNGRDIATPQDLHQALQRLGSRRDITLDIQRGEQQKEVRARLDGRSISHNSQDRYGRGQGAYSEEFRDIQEMQRRLQRLENRLRDIEQNQ